MRQDILVLHQTLFQIGIQLYQKTFFLNQPDEMSERFHGT